MMLMALHPDVQTRAQEEIDKISNPGEPIEHNRVEHLTYLLAVLKEVLRFAPVGPLCKQLCILLQKKLIFRIYRSPTQISKRR